ncbi:MAG: Asp-tRNA(Asn)/Glu-tRNA(Gln) amidotransferase subunit GatC [Thermodesulfobacteriota bacterium]
MAITKDDVRHVAGLARLAPTEEEITLYTEQLTRIIAHIENISKLDTEGVEPTSYTVPLREVVREDVIIESLSNEAALANAPVSERGCFKVPKIIE